MNDTQPLVRPEVATFVAEVRARLDDLTVDEREELLGGLEADLDEKVADGAPLGDPARYAEELRAAADLPVRTRHRSRPALPRPAHVERVLDASREWFLDLVRARGWTTRVWEVVSALRPVWWVARAWIAVTILDVGLGHWEPVSLVPSLGHPLTGWVALAVAVVGSTLLGTGTLWPGSGPRRGVGARVLLLGLNVAAVLLVPAFNISAPGYLTGTPHPWDGYSAGYADGQREPGLRGSGRQISNVFAYDAQGQPLSGVQLFDQDGRPVAVSAAGVCGAVVNRATTYNVFPLDRRPQGRGSCGDETRVTPQHPVAVVPAVDGVPAEAQAVPTPSKKAREEQGRKERGPDR